MRMPFDNNEVVRWVIGEPIPAGRPGIPPKFMSAKGYGDGDAVVCGECGAQCGEWCQNCGPVIVGSLDDTTLPPEIVFPLRDLEGWVGRRTWAVEARMVNGRWKVQEVLFCD